MALAYFADDELYTRTLLQRVLVRAGYDVRGFASGEALLSAMTESSCQIVLLDVLMPGLDGLATLERIRAISDVPVILLTACNGDDAYCEALAQGADDYVTKPFKPALLLAKMSALLRRSAMDSRGCGVDALILANLSYDPKVRELRVDGRVVPLSPLEQNLMGFYVSRPGQAVSKEELMASIWGAPGIQDMRAVEEANRRLRRKLAAAGSRALNETVWGYGYRFRAQEG